MTSVDMSLRGIAPAPCRPTRHTRKLLNRIKAAHRAGKTKKLQYLIRIYLNSHEARLTAVKLAYTRLKPHRRPPSVDFNGIAEKLNPWTGTDEEARVSLKPKRSNPNESRITIDFGLENRALQYLLLLLLRVIVELHPNQCAAKGGLHVAIKKTVDAIKDGFTWAVEVDIVDFFHSVNGERIPDIIPLPKKVSENILISRYLNLVPGNLIPLFGPDGEFLVKETLSSAQLGIPQGSAVSSILAEVVLTDVVKALPHGEVISYADNLLLLAKDEEGAVSMVNALKSALKGHPAGPLGPKIKQFPAGHPIEYLGHCITMNKDEIRVHPSPAKGLKFESVLRHRVEELRLKPNSLPKRIQLADELCRYVRSWAAAFKLCHGIEFKRTYWLKKVEKALSFAEKGPKMNVGTPN